MSQKKIEIFEPLKNKKSNKKIHPYTLYLIPYTLYLLPFTFYLLASSPAAAQNEKTWSLKECIDYAINNNIRIKQSKLNVDLAAEDLLQSKASALPNVNVFASHNYNFGRTVDPFTNEFVDKRVQSNSFSISGQVTLFSGFKTYNTIRQNEHNFTTAKYDTDIKVNDITLAVAGNYLQILFDKELAAIARNQVLITKEQLERTGKLVEAGMLAKGSLLQIEAQYSLDELQQVATQNQLDLSMLQMMQLLYIEPGSGFDIASPRIELPENTSVLGTPGQIYDAALAVQPQIKSANSKILSSEKGLAVAKGGHSPSLTLGGSYGTGYSDARSTLTGGALVYDTVGFTGSGDDVIIPTYNYITTTTPFKDQINDNINKTIGFNLSIPIFNGLQTKTGVSRAKIALKNAGYNMDLEKLLLKENIQKAFQDAVAALKKYRASEKTVNSLQESFNYTKQKFDVGMVTAVEFNDAKNKLVKSQSDLLQAKYDYIFKSKILDFYQGKPLDF